MKLPFSRIVLALLALAGFGLGSVGFHEASPSYSIPTAMLAAIQLFAFNSGVIEGRVPWQLEVARWAAVTFSVGALFEVALKLVRGGFTGVSLRLQRTSLGGGFNASQALHGLLDDVRIYDRLLNAQEIEGLSTLRLADTDGDGLPDYFEDRDGDGVHDTGETDWQHSNSGGSSSAYLNVFTPLQ